MEISSNYSYNRYDNYSYFDYAVNSKNESKSSVPLEKQNKNGKTAEEETQRSAQEMKNNEEKIKMHEMAHMSAGGGMAGSPSFSYATGPDGKQYIVGGEVPISIKTGNTPEETLRNMEQVKAAAMAPADPSSQDRAVAAKAAAIALKAAQEMANNMQDENGAKKSKDKGSMISIYA